LIGIASAPIVVDVRSAADLAAIDRLVPGAIHRSAGDVEAWWRQLPSARPVVVYDLSGGVASQRVVAELARYGTYAGYLIGGFIGWYDGGLPTRRNIVTSTRWVTRERPKIDRIACPWLIHRLTYRRTNHKNLHVRGYKEKGNINTPLDLAIQNQIDRFSLAIDVIDRVPTLEVAGAHAKEILRNMQIKSQNYAYEHGVDMPELDQWTWPA